MCFEGANDPTQYVILKRDYIAHLLKILQVSEMDSKVQKYISTKE